MLAIRGIAHLVIGLATRRDAVAIVVDRNCCCDPQDGSSARHNNRISRPVRQGNGRDIAFGRHHHAIADSGAGGGFDHAYIHSTRKATQTGSKPPRIDVRHRSVAGCDVDVLRAIGPHLRRILVNFRVFTDLGCSRDVVQLDCHHPTNTRI